MTFKTYNNRTRNRDGIPTFHNQKGDKLMGAWSEENFGNDDAWDWVWELEKSKGTEILLAPLRSILENDDYLESPGCSEALAAAEVVAAGVTGDFSLIPAEAKKWLNKKQSLFGKKPQIEKDHAIIAKQAVEKTLKASELKELWEETDDFSNWQVVQQNLISKLSNA